MNAETVSLPRRILVGIAFSDDPFADDFGLTPVDRAIIEQVRWYAGRVGGYVCFTHVIDGADHEVPGERLFTAHGRRRAAATRGLEELVANFADDRIRAEMRVLKGPSWHEMLMLAQTGAFEVIAVSTRRSHMPLYDRIVHGSTTRRLVRKSPIPVWVIGTDSHIPDRVLVPVDFSPVSELTVALANQWAACTGATRALLHCPEFPAEMSLRRLPNADEAIAAYTHDVLQAVDAKVHDLLGDSFEEWQVYIGDDWVGRVLPRIAREKEVDLVIMGSLGRSGLPGFLIGNTAEKLLNAYEGSVLVTKPAGWTTNAE